jgi:putative transposase
MNNQFYPMLPSVQKTGTHSGEKLDYIHNNPLATHWSLATDPCKYNYSTAKFYEDNKIDFTFMKDIRPEFS